MNTEVITSDLKTAVIGTGVSGTSMARFFVKRGRSFDVFDTRENPPNADLFRSEFPGSRCHFGAIADGALDTYSVLAISPGIDLAQTWLEQAKKESKSLVGDIELFARHVNKPVVAITGSNAKSTVTTLLGKMAKLAGINVAVGGNLGPAALDLLDESVELYVLELSSFQLELTENLQPSVATVLNISADHMDRHGSMESYHRAKHRIYTRAKTLVFNRDDMLTFPLQKENQSTISFGSDNPDLSQFGLNGHGDQRSLCKGKDIWVLADEIQLMGRHNYLNILAAFALGEAIGLDRSCMVEAAKEFKGLEHRCEVVSRGGGVSWINDSKATNVGATIAAIKGLGEQKNLVLILGGQAKGQRFIELKDLIVSHVKATILIGEDAPQIKDDLREVEPLQTVETLDQAIGLARTLAEENDIVLLSPACASFDQFSNFEERGRVFKKLVREVK